jgi:hypothetical protein
MRFLTSIEESVIHSLQFKTLRLVEVVPLAGIEPALLAESDFEFTTYASIILILKRFPH